MEVKGVDFTLPLTVAPNVTFSDDVQRLERSESCSTERNRKGRSKGKDKTGKDRTKLAHERVFFLSWAGFTALTHQGACLLQYFVKGL